MVVMRAGKKEEVWQKSWCGATWIIIEFWCCGEGGSMMWQRHWCRQLSLSFRSRHNNTRHNDTVTKCTATQRYNTQWDKWQNTQQDNYTMIQWYNNILLNKTLCSVDTSVDIPKSDPALTIRKNSVNQNWIRVWIMDVIEPKLGSISLVSLIVTNLLLSLQTLKVTCVTSNNMFTAARPMFHQHTKLV